MDDCDKAISVIQEYIDKCLFEPQTNWSKYYIWERSYSRWAAYEIQGRIIEEAFRLPVHITGREQQTPIEIIEEFINDMDNYSCFRDDKKPNPIFSIAKNAAEDILYLFL